jgi:phosphatidylglycerol---prolipoprotein diacylglyceryl transferase
MPLLPFQLPFPDIDPVLVSFRVFGAEIALRWYALAYIAGLVIGWRYVAALCRRPALWGGSPPMPAAKADDLLTWMVVAVILGGRIGYALFYQPAHYLGNPLEILAIWRGGMSFHGGFIGVVFVTVLFAWRNGAPVIRLGDAVAVVAPIGLFFGRIANFINAELWGRPTAAPWGVVFPTWDAQTCPEGWIGVCARHPSQLYQAGLEGLALFLVLAWVVFRLGWLRHPGRATGVFLAGYASARIFVEFFRQGDPQFVSPANPWGLIIRFGSGIESWGLTMGQLLSIPMLLLGVWLIAGRRRVAA